MLTAFVFILVLGILIFVHELGHFLAARAAGIKVEEFAFGFPPRLISWKRGETRYALNLFPIGGYVRLLGEDGGSNDPRSFAKQSVWVRLGVILAGVVMNIILALVVLWLGFMIGMVPLVSAPKDLGGTQSSQVLITGVVKGSAADKVGIVPGDIVSGFDSPEALQTFTKGHAGETITLKLVRDKAEVTKEIALPAGSEAPLGIGIAELTKVKLGPVGALKAAFIETGKSVTVTFQFLGSLFRQLFIHAQLPEGVSGPVGIYAVTGQAVKLGFTYVLQLLALLSINLAMLNVVPFPALDGGRALFVLLEGLVRRKVVREEIEGIIHAIGFGLLLLLIVAITYKDIVNLR